MPTRIREETFAATRVNVVVLSESGCETNGEVLTEVETVEEAPTGLFCLLVATFVCEVKRNLRRDEDKATDDGVQK